MLGIPPSDMSIDWTKVIFKACSLKVFTVVRCLKPGTRWGADSVWPRSLADHYPSFLYRDFQKGFDAMRSGQSGKVILTGINTNKGWYSSPFA